MGRTPWATYLWPGLPQVWRRGEWSALALAVGFAALVNLTLVASFVWTELLPEGLRRGAWAAVLVVWVGSAMVARIRSGGDEAGSGSTPSDQSFPKAVEHYLKGNWFEAESLFVELLRRNPRDLDAGLMLATLLRHTGRLDEAAEQLDRLERFDGAEKWALEIYRERQWLKTAQSEPDGESVESTNGD